MILGIGVDHIEIERVKKVSAKFPRRFSARIFTEGERNYIKTRANPYESMASRFAAKEACMKALGTGLSMGITWKDIAVERSGGPPRLHLSGQARTIFDRMGGKNLYVSLSHSSNSAVAFVVIEA